MTRDRDNVPRWLNQLLILITAAVIALVVFAGASYARADYGSPPTSEETTTTWPTDTTAPAPTSTTATSTPPTTSPGPSTTSPTSPTTSTSSPSSVPSTEPPAPTSTQPSSTVSVAPPPVPPTTCPPDPAGRADGPDCTIDPCLIHELGYWSDDYLGGHLPGGDHGFTRYHAWHCTVPTAPPTTVTPQLPVTGNTSALWLTIAGAAAVLLGTILVAGARRR